MTYSETVGIVIIALTWTIGLGVFLVAPGRPLNRILGAVLFVEGLGAGFLRINDDLQSVGIGRATTVLGNAAVLVMPILYLLFLGSALQTPLVKPFQQRLVRRVLYALLCAASFFAVWQTEAAYGINEYVSLLLGFMLLYNLVAAIHAWRSTAPRSHRREHAKWFVIAFGIRDAIMAPVLLVVYSPLGHAIVVPNLLTTALLFAALLYAPLLAYAILRVQLFDIDLRIKWAIGRSTVAFVFLAAFVAATAAFQEWLGETQGVVVGGAAAGLLVFVLAPLQRAADRLAQGVLPHATGSPEYLAFRKMDVFRAALESAQLDSRVTIREHQMLESLRKKLGITEADAELIARDLPR